MELLRYVAFSDRVDGGNPAGIVLDAAGISPDEMLEVAAEVGYSETAFVTERSDRTLTVRYFSPKVEVPFCGHATIATAVAFADVHGPGELLLHTQAGEIRVSTSVTPAGLTVATLVSVPPRVDAMDDALVRELLSILGWSPTDLDPTLPPRVANAGASHPIIAAATHERLSDLVYDFPALAELMDRVGWTTINLVWRERSDVFHARNPFPPGGVVEDPATGAAAAAFGGYLRALGLLTPPATATVYQGQDMGRPSTITLSIPEDPASGISVTGTAVAL
ncbi:PhzF family phenazine biosynthesis protein [Nonomuraea jiangxiensis]|uniref:Phenazine biosynthesis protein PhzF family n=1 Tax=Nonomuraea jiangxiensis TaxID=633440 RepID=A0A1G9WHS6_9ACTN|nr:PhzF family phenazine biosynthesis isomerase [Nonomuraea jiangxiensis]SDM83615.1 phenazine biosynthesis protein PhzF family [Nonomuraea jiangxiensis]